MMKIKSAVNERHNSCYRCAYGCVVWKSSYILFIQANLELKIVCCSTSCLASLHGCFVILLLTTWRSLHWLFYISNKGTSATIPEEAFWRSWKLSALWHYHLVNYDRCHVHSCGIVCTNYWHSDSSWCEKSDMWCTALWRSLDSECEVAQYVINLLNVFFFLAVLEFLVIVTGHGSATCITTTHFTWVLVFSLPPKWPFLIASFLLSTSVPSKPTLWFFCQIEDYLI